MRNRLRICGLFVAAATVVTLPVSAYADGLGSGADATSSPDGTVSQTLTVVIAGNGGGTHEISVPGAGGSGGGYQPTQAEIDAAIAAEVNRIRVCQQDSMVNFDLVAFENCTRPPEPGTPAQTTITIPAPSSSEIIATVKNQIRLPLPTPVIEPAPERNEWDMVAVGYPLWLHVDGPTQMRSTATVQGFTIALVAARGPITFTMGDGSQVVCGRTTPWNINQAGVASPTCGYTYTKKSLPHGTYTVTVTTTWTVNWYGAGQSGTLTVDRTDSRQLPVGELQTVVTGR